MGYSTIKPLSRVRAAARTPKGRNRAAAREAYEGSRGPSRALLDGDLLLGSQQRRRLEAKTKGFLGEGKIASPASAARGFWGFGFAS